MLVGENLTLVGEKRFRLGLGMGQANDGTVQAERHNEARAWLAFLIDHPDKSVSVDEYKAQLTTARRAVASTYKALVESRG